MKKEKRLKQVFAVFGLCAVMAAVPAGIVNAEDAGSGSTEMEVQGQAEYDLEKGGTQSFEIVDENGEETEIVVEEVPGIARVANGTYKISRNRKGCWTAGFYVNVEGNKLVKAHDKFYKVTKGRISEIKLSKDSTTQATLTLRYHYSGTTNIWKVRAKIFNKKLVVEIS